VGGPSATPLEVVLVHLGSKPPRYFHVSADQVRAVTRRDPILIGPRLGARYDSPKLRAFREGEHLSQFGLNGFWRYTCERFFVLEEHMRRTGLSRCIHIESDNLLYVTPSAFAEWLVSTHGDSIAVCPFTFAEDTAAVMYVGSLDSLALFTDAMLELVTTPPHDLLAAHGGTMANEMRMLYLLRREGLCGALPVTVEEAESTGAGHVFDPGSYGQYVDGWYWEPGVPYTSDKHLVGQALADQHYRLYWNAGREAPLVSRATGEPQPLVNLHVHSKRLEEWRPRQLTPPNRPAGFPSEAALRPRVRKAANSVLATASRIRRRGR
jgi:hypothetical protein